MGKDSNIQWTTHTFNPWRGCTKIAPGCANCYADAQSKRNPATLAVWGPNGTRVLASPKMWREPIKWNEQAAYAEIDHEAEANLGKDLGAYERPRVFCASLADVFEDWKGRIVDSHGGTIHFGKPWGERDKFVVRDELIGKSVVQLDDVRRELFAMIDATPNLDWLLVTKRPENIRRMWPARDRHYDERLDSQHNPHFRKNVWLLTSVATQADVDKNIPELLKCRDLAPVLGVSAEPLIDKVDFDYVIPDRRFPGTWFDVLGGVAVTPRSQQLCDTLNWVIVGGESGPNARPCNIEWIRTIVAKCRAAAVPVFVKQLGADPMSRKRTSAADLLFPGGVPAGVEVSGFSESTTTFELDDKKGGDPSEWPEDLRVRQFPTLHKV